MNSIIITGQLTKHFIKEQIKEPRPYMIWLSKIHNFDKRIFHHLRRDEVTNIVSIMLSQDTQIPRWLKNYWIQESSFSFPSGHSIFVTTWSLLATILLWPRRYIKTVVFLFLWADAVMASRLFLGMHWSWDLIFAILLSWLLIIAFTCIKIVSSFFLIKNYEQDF
ncbi:phosphatase PAP2 family protein [Candidatus Ishikawella capsulata]|nr:phosphatase PAP2 family protein [Candidatus Ishikawaella capsulata]